MLNCSRSAVSRNWYSTELWLQLFPGESEVPGESREAAGDGQELDQEGADGGHHVLHQSTIWHHADSGIAILLIRSATHALFVGWRRSLVIISRNFAKKY
jgi:hypothetical protein